MELTIGKALREARLKKGMSPAEVAKATLIRVDWITDLENEDYHRFPSLSYARNFQILYAKYLEVDVQKAAMIDPGKVVLTTSFDHVYEGISPVGYRGTPRPKPIRRTRWIAAIIIFVIASAIGCITALFILDILRLPSWEEMMGEESAPDAEERLVVPPSVDLPPSEAPSPAPEATPSEELPPLADDGTMHPPTAPPPPRFELLPPPAEWQKLLPEEEPLHTPSPTPVEEEGAEPAFPFASDAEALATPFPSETPEPSAAPDEPTPAGREPAGTPAATPATPALP